MAIKKTSVKKAVIKKTPVKKITSKPAVAKKTTARKAVSVKATSAVKVKQPASRASGKVSTASESATASGKGKAVGKTLVGIVMGSTSDWEVMKEAAQMCKAFDIPYEARALSAHRSPTELEEWIVDMEKRGCQAFIAGAGGAAHLAGVVAAQTILPTFGVPMPSKYMKGLDSLLATVQMPKGIPVPTMAIGEAGAANATLAVVAMMALTDPVLKKKLLEFRAKQSEKVRQASLPELK